MNFFPDIRMDGVHYGFAEMRAPWCVVIPPNNCAALYVIRGGSCYFESSEGRSEPIHMSEGSVVGVTGGQRVTFRDSLSTPTFRTEAGFPITGYENLAGASTSPGEVTRFLIGQVSRSSNLLIQMLPPFVHVSSKQEGASARLNQTLALITSELTLAARQEAGPESVVRRLSENIVIELARVSLKQEGNRGGNWLAGLSDKYVTQAVVLLNCTPEKNWTVQLLATEVGLSRSAFADRFSRLIGEGPMTFLLNIRIEKAIALIREGRLSLKEIAAAVGYRSETSFSRAVARETGKAPGEYRRDCTTIKGPMPGRRRAQFRADLKG